MKSQINNLRVIIFMFTILLLSPVMINAQLISIKTVPVATGDQFLLFPSQNLGMGGVAIAIDDPWLDPFVNPAKGSRMNDTRLFISPFFYHITDDIGGARTLPMSLYYDTSQWFGEISLSIQQLDMSQPDRGVQAIPTWNSSSPNNVNNDIYSNNIYAFGAIGRTFSDSKTSIAASLFWAGLKEMEGVNLLYSQQK